MEQQQAEGPPPEGNDPEVLPTREVAIQWVLIGPWYDEDFDCWSIVCSVEDDGEVFVDEFNYDEPEEALRIYKQVNFSMKPVVIEVVWPRDYDDARVRKRKLI